MLELRTPRLVLRDWQQGDLPALGALASDERVTRYQPWLRFPDDVACRRWLEESINHNSADPRSRYSLAVVNRSIDHTIGWLNWCDAEDASRGEVSFGYALLPEVWGRGYMTEAVEAMLTLVFDVQQRNSVYASCATGNHASARVLEKAGLRLVDRTMRRDDTLGIEEEHTRYALKRSHWRPTGTTNQPAERLKD